MKLTVVTPVWIQSNAATIEMTYDCVSRLRARLEVELYVVSNRLHLVSPEDFQAGLSARCPAPVRLLHEPGVSRSVAGAWNEGVWRGVRDGSGLFLVLANDCLLDPDTVDRLAEFGRDPANRDVHLWSGIDTRTHPVIEDTEVTDGVDFTCAMFRRETVLRHGYFDALYRPAYFEDNDYYARVVLGGGHCRVVHGAKFYHHGSATIAMEPEAAHHARQHFEANRARFRGKWGVDKPASGEAEVLAKYHRRPWNDPNRLLSSW